MGTNLVEKNFADFPGRFIWNMTNMNKNIVTHVLTAKNTLILTVAIGNGTVQVQQLVVSKEVGSICSDSRVCDVIMACIHQ